MLLANGKESKTTYSFYRLLEHWTCTWNVCVSLLVHGHRNLSINFYCILYSFRLHHTIQSVSNFVEKLIHLNSRSSRSLGARLCLRFLMKSDNNKSTQKKNQSTTIIWIFFFSDIFTLSITTSLLTVIFINKLQIEPKMHLKKFNETNDYILDSYRIFNRFFYKLNGKMVLNSSVVHTVQTKQSFRFTTTPIPITHKVKLLLFQLTFDQHTTQRVC